MGLKVLVTGASSGIGRATALRFSKNGHDVFATGRSESKLLETAKLAEDLGGPAIHTTVGDVSVEADVLKNLEEAKKVFGGRFDVIVLNAGLGWVQPLEDHSVEDYDHIFGTNVRGVFLWLKFILPVLKSQGSGQIVLINSIAGLGTTGFVAGGSIYSATKFALNGMAQCLRLEVKGTGIKVASVHPGAVDTSIWSVPQWEKAGTNPREVFGEHLANAMAPEDIADVIESIVLQHPRSDIETVVVWPNLGLKKP